MEYEVDSLITFPNDKKSLVLDKIIVDNRTYLLLNEMANDDDFMEIYYVMEVMDDNVSLKNITDEDKLNKLLPLFSNRAQKIVSYYFENINKKKVGDLNE